MRFSCLCRFLARTAGLACCWLAFSAPTAMAFEPVTPIPEQGASHHAKALLGRALFRDPLLSRDRTISCASCHDLGEGGDDHRRVSLGVQGAAGVMNAPTVFNAVFNFRQFWNGRAGDLRAQAAGPLHNPVEMRMSRAEVEQRLNNNAAYRKSFREIYGRERVIFEDVLDAIAEFEKALTTPGSRFDRALRGELALGEEERKGYLAFKELGCVTCHNGVNLGGNSFQKVGVLNAFAWEGRHEDRFKVTGQAIDRNIYKVPTLRNVALTAPYFHDGSQKTLAEALKAMAFHNLGLQLTRAEERTLLAFLHTLTGRRPAILADDGRHPPAPPAR